MTTTIVTGKNLGWWDATGNRWVTLAAASSPPPAGPSSWLTTAFTPGGDRNDFDGEVGVRFGIGAANIPFSWLGARCLHTGDTGTRKLTLYEWFSGNVVVTGNVDLTGKTAGQYAWVQVAPNTMLANGYYALLMDVTPGMQAWANSPGPVTYAASIVNVYEAYKTRGGALANGLNNSQFVGVDVGW